jgi:dihydrolipoamide dehydrogenase
MPEKNHIVIIGSGPGGYAAAFRASDLGNKVTLVEKDVSLGGVCLNRGCIPSKTLLHISKIIDEAESVKKFGVTYPSPTIDMKKIQSWKNRVIKKLGGGIKLLAKKRNVNVIHGTANFISDKSIKVTNDEEQIINFDKCIIATGSRPNSLPFVDIDHKNILDSTSALSLDAVPKTMLVVGGGYIGLEMATAYSSLGTKVDVVEFLPRLLPGADIDLVDVLAKTLNNKLNNIYLNTKVTSISNLKKSVKVSMESDGKKLSENYDKALISVGRTPNTDNLSLDNVGITMSKEGFIEVDEYRRTNIDNIFAIGDITGNPMLAHKATHEGKVAAEVCTNIPSAFQPQVIPAVIFTDPEIAWAGKTEEELTSNNIAYEKSEFPWQASGKAIAMDRTEGKTKILFEPDSKRVIGVGIVGYNASDLIGEAALAIEMGCYSEDIALTIHPHPTLTETFSNAAEVMEKTITDLYIP